jgi:hypothetical protein
MASATSMVLHGGDLVKSLKKFNWGDIDGVLLEYDSENVFVPDSLIEKILDYRKETSRYISHFTASKYVRELEELNKRSSIHMRDQTFLFSCKARLRNDEELSEKQRKTIEDLYLKYEKEINLSKDALKSMDDIPF